MPLQTPPRKKRSAIACVKCHDRKVRCNAATQGIPCGNCVQDGIPCQLYGRKALMSVPLSNTCSGIYSLFALEESNNYDFARGQRLSRVSIMNSLHHHQEQPIVSAKTTTAAKRSCTSGLHFTRATRPLSISLHCLQRPRLPRTRMTNHRV